MTDDDEMTPTKPVNLVDFAGKAERERDAKPWTGLLAGYSGATRRAAVDAFLPYTVDLEGGLPWMYLDTKELVTTGLGNLIDPIVLAYPVLWRTPDGRHATRDEITDCWTAVKAATFLAPHGGYGFRGVEGNTLRLDGAALAALVGWRFRENNNALERRFAKFAEWPADAQLAVHSMAWAMGPERFDDFPIFCRYMRADPPDFHAAAPQSHMADGAPKRNASQRLMLELAAQSQVEGTDPDILLFDVPDASASWRF